MSDGAPDFDSDFEQDHAEIFDETHLTENGEEIANFDEIEDVFDDTARDGDADEDEFDENEVDEDDLEEDDELNYRAVPAPDNEVMLELEERRPDDDPDPAPPRPGAVDPVDILPDEPQLQTEAATREAVEESFPAVDPPLIRPMKGWTTGR
jgi:hypothetical protein